MNVVIIQHPTHGLIAVVENPGGMSKEAVAIAWSRSEGYKGIPENLEVTEIELISYGVIQRKLTPCHELEELERAGSEL